VKALTISKQTSVSVARSWIWQKGGREGRREGGRAGGREGGQEGGGRKVRDNITRRVGMVCAWMREREGGREGPGTSEVVVLVVVVFLPPSLLTSLSFLLDASLNLRLQRVTLTVTTP